MFTLLTILIIVACLLLIFVVLIQNPKGGGVASNFSSSNQIMGVKRTSEAVEKATWILAVAVMVFALATNFFIPSISSDTDTPSKSLIQEKIDNAQAPAQQQQQQQPAAPAPGQESQQQTQPAPADGAAPETK
ncbi:MAG TPA: preprotein translocase subunit SecG [Bacteroidia bacterium]|nr:preprotein translocase subunit SecG [Bacteroidia bacterium]